MEIWNRNAKIGTEWRYGIEMIGMEIAGMEYTALTF